MNNKFTLEPLQLVGWFVVVLGSYAWIPGTNNEINNYSLSGDIEFESASMKWSGKIGQRTKMYPTRMNGYANDDATELFRQV